MKLMIDQTLKALCALAVATLLVACGASKTVDPLVPTRVIGLGDAHNDTGANQYTVRGTGEVSTVVGQVAALFGGGATVTSYASSTYAPGDLHAQVAGLGALQASDLIVITAGAAEYASAGSVTARADLFLNELIDALDILKAKGAKHILIMSLVDTAINPDQNVVTFNSRISGNLGSYTDVARFTEIGRPAAASIPFPNWATNTNTPYCPAPNPPQGCGVIGGQDASLYFLADSVNPTPVANRWIAQYLYNNTAQGWR